MEQTQFSLQEQLSSMQNMLVAQQNEINILNTKLKNLEECHQNEIANLHRSYQEAMKQKEYELEKRRDELDSIYSGIERIIRKLRKPSKPTQAETEESGEKESEDPEERETSKKARK